MKNLEITFLGYNKIDGYCLDKLTADSKGLVVALEKSYNLEELKDGVQPYDYNGTTYIIEVLTDCEEIHVIDTL